MSADTRDLHDAYPPTTVREELTAKQSAFADGLMAGLSQPKAYRRAYDVQGMSAHNVAVEAGRLAHHPVIAPLLHARREAASDAVDAARVRAMLGAPANLARLYAIAALPVESDLENGIVADARTLPSTRGAIETLLGIADVIPRAPGATVDKRNVTLNVGARDERLAGRSVDELTAIIEQLRAGREPGSQAIDTPAEPEV